ncbi:FMN-binding negative transcriptional regulator [Acidobacteria bacterium AB60]|nr:FMN-binding negative transcriptional regulator [Acidobacteria bacterium AB60]
MYIPRFNQITERGVLLEAMQRYSFAILFGASGGGAEGGMQATHLPLVVRDEGEHGVVLGHFAKANTHWAALAGRETLVVFPGPHSYISPSLYAEPLSVPTWNYITVHAYGRLEALEDPAIKSDLLEELIRVHEPGYLSQWQGMPEGFRRSMLAGITGFRIPIARIEGKFKLSQNRPAAERENIWRAQAAGSDDERELARWMERLMPRSEVTLPDLESRRS